MPSVVCTQFEKIIMTKDCSRWAANVRSHKLLGTHHIWWWAQSISIQHHGSPVPKIILPCSSPVNIIILLFWHNFYNCSILSKYCLLSFKTYADSYSLLWVKWLCCRLSCVIEEVLNTIFLFFNGRNVR